MAEQSGQTGPDIRDDRAAGRLLASVDGEAAGVIDYFVMDGTPAALVAVHTVVEPGHEGKGIGGALVREFYALAARDGVPVVPLCPYAAKWASRHPDEAPEAPAELVERAKEQLASHPELY
ncbi:MULTISPECIES: GNAT family N-acetyltransferase [unclassified Streptomyces]|uniref:GNAT family N-acetyltransferase n=1 Tax=unclassified Streptomyces TaxID=2593676 RepID=UPI0022533E64|nr:MULTISPECIES: GNAT family N-acetyltransferase [unclassified Streptomyces]MCX5144571.1 N-acetyltransferase [Streptomyces sp. NBC_00338]WRZ68936.1 N-acetyltransferase [Streptomyces sp. NBC_01257]WSU62886.1 N-acetyltransferase [Streptomyces sp. NBC_01104]